MARVDNCRRDASSHSRYGSPTTPLPPQNSSGPPDEEEPTDELEGCALLDGARLLELPGSNDDDDTRTLELEVTNDEEPTSDEDCTRDDEGGANDEERGAELEGNTNEDDPGADDGGVLLLIMLLLPGPDDVIPVLEDPPEAPLEEVPACELDIPTDEETRLDTVKLLDTPRLLPPSDVLAPLLEEDAVAWSSPHTPSWPHT